MTTYIHYGSSKFHSFFPVKNQTMNTKPIGGLWASPIDSCKGWREWCERTQFQYANLDEYFKFHLTDGAKILHIQCATQLDHLPHQHLNDGVCGIEIQSIYTMLDFEALQKEYDGIELHLSEEIFPDDVNWNYKSLYYRLYGWNCDSLLVFNDKVIKLTNE